MSKPFIFVSCGQYTPAEKALGKTIVKMVKDVTGLDAFFAEEVQDLNGLDANILYALRDCAAFISVLHPRGKITRPDGKENVRASVWIEQEIAIATYIQRIEKRPLPVIAFVHDSVGREGIRDLLHLNPMLFAKESDVIEALTDRLLSWRGLRPSGIRLELEIRPMRPWKDHHNYSELYVYLVNETNRLLNDVSFIAKIPKGALVHDGGLEEDERVNRYEDASYYVIRQTTFSPVAPHDTQLLDRYFFCSTCALKDSNYEKKLGSPITPDSLVQIRLWTGEREYSVERTLKELRVEEAKHTR